MIESEKYLKIFNSVADRLNQQQLKEMQLEAAVVEVLNCVCLKIYKRAWATPNENPLQARSRIFFAVWISDESIAGQTMFYNIHAFKLRHLSGYNIESRKFAALFRTNFTPFKAQWPNVSVEYGPLTLMKGYVKTDADHFEAEILQLANRFFSIAPLIDSTLASFKK